MKRWLKLCACLSVLLLSGCYLKLDIVGQGTVTSDWDDFNCSQSCTKVSVSGLKMPLLRGTPAEGYTFLGFVLPDDAVFEVDYPTALVQYGIGAEFGLTESPNQSVMLYGAHVIALFEPQENIQQIARTARSICRLDVFNTVQCWGHSAEKPGPAFDGLVRSIVVDANRPYFKPNLCFLTDDQVMCRDEMHDLDWTIPAALTAPIAGAMRGDVLCVLHGIGAGSVDCFDASGSPVLNIPPLSVPAHLRVEASGQFCVDDGGTAVCWSSDV